MIAAKLILYAYLFLENQPAELVEIAALYRAIVGRSRSEKTIVKNYRLLFSDYVIDGVLGEHRLELEILDEQE